MYIAYDDNDMICGNSVDNNFGFLVYTVLPRLVIILHIVS